MNSHQRKVARRIRERDARRVDELVEKFLAKADPEYHLSAHEGARTAPEAPELPEAVAEAAEQPPEAALTLVERPLDLGAGQVYPPGKPTPREAFETLGKIVREVTRETGVGPGSLVNLKFPTGD